MAVDPLRNDTRHPGNPIWEAIRRLQLVLAIVVAAFCVFAYAALWDLGDDRPWVSELLLQLLPAIILLCGLYVVTSLIFRRAKISSVDEAIAAIRNETETIRLEEVDWQIQNGHASRSVLSSNSVLFVGRFFDDLLMPYTNELRSFVAAGGRIRTLLPDESEAVLSPMQEQRPGVNLVERLAKTVELLEFIGTANAGNVEIRTASGSINYFAVVPDRGPVSITPYEHSFVVGHRAPSFVATDSSAERLRSFLEFEWSEAAKRTPQTADPTGLP